MKVKADGEGSSGKTYQLVLAAQVLAVGGEEHLTGINQSEALAVAVVARRDPLLPLMLGTLAGDGRRCAANRAVCSDLKRICIRDHHDRMCGTCARHAPPIRFGTA